MMRAERRRRVQGGRGLSPDDVRWIAAAAVLTIADAWLTYLWLRHDVAVEVNPLLSEFVLRTGAARSMVLRSVWGLALLGALSVFVPRSRMARQGLTLAVGALGLAFGMHTYGVIALLW